ncbi:MAG: hypothetical protein WCH39_04625, partial [Schlesneria sp.]
MHTRAIDDQTDVPSLIIPNTPSWNTRPKIVSQFVVQKLIAGFVIALGLTTFEHFALLAQETARAAT